MTCCTQNTFTKVYTSVLFTSLHCVYWLYECTAYENRQRRRENAHTSGSGVIHTAETTGTEIQDTGIDATTNVSMSQSTHIHDRQSSSADNTVLNANATTFLSSDTVTRPILKQ